MRYVALFRGINVGGKNKVAMADLRKALSGLGLASVQTYIQSGNALFDSELSEGELVPLIEQGFKAAFGFESAVVLRTADQLAAIINNLPFSEAEIAQAAQDAAGAECLYCHLLADVAPAERIDALNAADGGPDRLVASGREVYLLCHRSILDSKLAASLSKLKLPMTARNLKTLRKLHALVTAGNPAPQS